MASAQSNHVQGTMPVDAQSRTFGGFMNLTVYGGCFITFLLLYPILAFSTPLSWLPSLIISAVVGIILGVIFKLKGGWFATIVGVSIFLVILRVVILTASSLVA